MIIILILASSNNDKNSNNNNNLLKKNKKVTMVHLIILDHIGVPCCFSLFLNTAAGSIRQMITSRLLVLAALDSRRLSYIIILLATM
jgi:hypothetical protein